MKAILFHHYGPPDVLTCEDAEKPAPGDSEVLLKVRAASVNPLDWHGMRGKPYVMRLMGGLRKPKRPRLGVDVAGQVEAIGKNVAQFKPGDEVFGGCLGLWAFAEYACAPASQLVAKPANLTFEQAASVPVAGFTALQALRDKGQVQPGQKVLINGAAGGVGTFAVQVAKWLGADVTGVCSTRNVERVRSLGADRVIDYTQENFTKGAQRHDLILDAVGNHPLSALRRALTTTGICVIAAGPDGLWLGPLSRFVEALALSPFVSQKLVPFIANPNRDDLTILRDLMASGKIKPVIDRCYKLTEIPAAVRYLEEGHARGKVIITV
jgi:NADPH:quinone reductase-like Zn-dependent oxidoreductase